MSIKTRSTITDDGWIQLFSQDDYTANNFGQQESRDGYSAQGEYFVNLPDGRLQKVIIVVIKIWQHAHAFFDAMEMRT